MNSPPQAILQALGIDPDSAKCTLDTSGFGSGFSRTSVLHIEPKAQENTGPGRKYFIKTSHDGAASKEMFHGEYESLNAIANAVPDFCPRALAWGPLDQKKAYFLATEFLELKGRWARTSADADVRKHGSLAYRLGQLHKTPAPVDPETGRRRYGFPVPTYCGDTKQRNHFTDSWAEFYANERLLAVLALSEKQNGPDEELSELVGRTAHAVVPRLLGDGHLGYDSQGNGDGIQPVVVHGDLWSGNTDYGRIVGSERGDSEMGDVVYDSSACYAHSEFDIGIMHMFGGFGPDFFDQYHRIVPKTEPVEEYDDRIRLYELYHHLNHQAIFGGGYRSGAMSIMKKLIRKYSDTS
ncbi:hypothetical protein N7539_007472 [Penicillium diatomitis]|uniref:protein-ribulosamine 3-kinase n=1 Tax=Penicillium diatomitis TaxID=2819901 RepID=A0A9W9WV84_9EURO|nr:uncharacterized protein N7539_007472 [Penicillium diatomitis]KAJ5477328.1 hypothetical protein N7539_007472 [Penicillium diatomitis]